MPAITTACNPDTPVDEHDPELADFLCSAVLLSALHDDPDLDVALRAVAEAPVVTEGLIDAVIDAQTALCERLGRTPSENRE